jgi:hypothetical protein
MRGGYVSFAKELFERFRESILSSESNGSLEKDIYNIAIDMEQLKLATKFITDCNLSPIDIQSIANFACQSGKVEILKYAIEQGARPAMDYVVRLFFSPAVEILEFLSEAFPQMIKDNINEIGDKIQTVPRIETLRWAEKNGYDFTRDINKRKEFFFSESLSARNRIESMRFLQKKRNRLFGCPLEMHVENCNGVTSFDDLQEIFSLIEITPEGQHHWTYADFARFYFEFTDPLDPKCVELVYTMGGTFRANDKFYNTIPS